MYLGDHLNENLSLNEEIRFKNKNQDLIQQLAKTLPFTENEIQHIFLIYYSIMKSEADAGDPEAAMRGISKNHLRDIFHYGLDMTDYRLIDKIVSVADKGINPFVSLTNFTKTVALYTKGSLEEKIQYCYDCYHTIATGPHILRNTILNLLKYSVVKESTEEDAADAIDESIKDLADLLIKKMDFDRDGKVSFEDYKRTVLETPLMLECFGPTLPTRLSAYSFSTSFTSRIRKM